MDITLPTLPSDQDLNFFNYITCYLLHVAVALPCAIDDQSKDMLTVDTTKSAGHYLASKSLAKSPKLHAMYSKEHDIANGTITTPVGIPWDPWEIESPGT